MRWFVCILDPAALGISDALRNRYGLLARRRGLQCRWQHFRQGAVLLPEEDQPGEPLLTGDAECIAIGSVRLDNRSHLAVPTIPDASSSSDLEMVRRLVVRHGVDQIAHLLGDFAFVLWYPATGSVIGAVDAFAVKKLYFAEHGGLILLATRAGLLACNEEYDLQCLAEWVMGCAQSPSLTAYKGVGAVPAGHVLLLDRGRLTVREYWSPYSFASESNEAMDVRAAVDTLRRLLIYSVRLHLQHSSGVWAQLSGGLDSSSVVSIAQSLFEAGAVSHGLAGTVTYVDREGTGADEREYSNVIVRRWGVRNEVIVDPPLWYDDRYPLPDVDQPRPDFLFYPRECRLSEIVRRAGGRVVLTGQASDELLRGNMFFFADWIVDGRMRSAINEMVRRAAIGHVSFWELAYRNAITPLLPRFTRSWLGPELTRVPRWIHPRVVSQYGFADRAYEMALYAGRVGHKYRDAVAAGLQTVSRVAGYVSLEDELEVRHPFLYRPFVEFALRLPPELCVQPHARKWVLREAMRGLVPDAVRLRVGKGTTVERYAWSLAAQRSLLEPLIRHSILADLGLVRPVELRTAFNSAPTCPKRKGDPQAALQGVLGVEAWLQMRAGRWPRGITTRASQTVSFTLPQGTQGGSYEEDLPHPSRGSQRQHRP